MSSKINMNNYANKYNKITYIRNYVYRYLFNLYIYILYNIM